MANSQVGEVVQRPWGQYEVLWEGPGVLLKRLTVRAGEETSYQYHRKRDEFWNVVGGHGHATLCDAAITASLSTGITVNVPREVKHSIKAGGRDLVIYELQVGEPDEDDIVRLSDKYGRV